MISNKLKAMLVTIMTIIVLTPVIVSTFKSKPAGSGAPETLQSPSREIHGPAFVDDPAVVGSWSSVDFVQTIDSFVPGKKSWSGDLYLKGLEFKPGGKTSGPWDWTKGTLWHPGDQTLAKYTIRDIGGVQYLFMEWFSGDVTVRGQKPKYYVMARGDHANAELHQTVAPSAGPPAFVDDPAAIGSWSSVDFVQTIDEFVPGKKSWPGDLDLKGLQFNPGGSTSGVWQWSKGTLWHPGDRTLAKYAIRDIGGVQYLFMEWISGDVTLRGQKPRYYVMTRVQNSASLQPQEAIQPAESPVQAQAQATVQLPYSAAVGSWTTVDFVKNYGDFVPGQRQWSGEFSLKGLQFRPNGTTSGPWTWGGGVLWHPGDKTRSRYAIQKIGGRQYLFLEWMSGDVTLRGEKPHLYIMTKN